MGCKVLITGGAGFIGSHLADELLAHGFEVRILDCLSPQVHGYGLRRPRYLNQDVELQIGDVRDARTVEKALTGVGAVFHFAAKVGVGQSMYRIRDYTSTNAMGTAVLLESLIEHPVGRLVVASSMSVYGEGLYRSVDGKHVDGRERSVEQLQAHEWDLRDGNGQLLEPLPTPEWKRPAMPSVYALGKYEQERLCLTVGRAYGISTAALRFFNVYGPRQALSNPYTGVLAIFASRLLNGLPPKINEDGLQRRDFVSVHDVARACRLTLETPDAGGRVFNVGSGAHYNVRQIASLLGRALGREIEPQITGNYRVGDIRHCFADISLAREVLGYAPSIRLEEGLRELAESLDGEHPEDKVADAERELAMHGLRL